MIWVRRCLLGTVVLCALGLSFGQSHGQTLTVASDPSTLAVATAVPGSAPTPVLESSTTYSVTTTLPGAVLKARLDVGVPAGVQLRVTLTPPAGATGMGEVTLGTTDQDVVRDLPVGTNTGLPITYRLIASVSAGVVALSTRSVIFTLIETP